MAPQLQFLDQVDDRARGAWLPAVGVGVEPAAAVLNLEGADEVEDLLERAAEEQFAAKCQDRAEWMAARVAEGWPEETVGQLETLWMADSMERRPDLWDEFAGVPGTGPQLHFNSGSNHEGEILGTAAVGEHVGVAVNRLSPDAERALIALAELPEAAAVRVFADSGAFEECSSGVEIDEREWKARLATYRRLGAALGGRVTVVAPDRIGDQQGTLERLARFSGHLADVAATGAEVLVSVVGPRDETGLDRVTYWKAAQRAAGLDGNWVPAMPMKKCPASPAEVEAFVAAVRPARLHLLGLGPRSASWGAVLAAVRRGSAGCEVSSDSVWLCSVVGRKSGLRVGTRERDSLLAAGFDPADVTGLKEAWVGRALRRQAHQTLLGLARGGWRWRGDGEVQQRPLL